MKPVHLLMRVTAAALLLAAPAYAQTPGPVSVAAGKVGETGALRIARVHYNGGGDWYNDPSAETNLLKFIAANTTIPVRADFTPVELSSAAIFSYPILFLTGHGNVNFTEQEVANLRAYLANGGFLYIDDDYGLDEHIRREMKRVFPDKSFAELPFSHPLFSVVYKFPKGVPKIHEHDNKSPQSFGLFNGQRLCVLYTYESNPSDGWADPEVHPNPPEKRRSALEFGVNIVVFALSQ